MERRSFLQAGLGAGALSAAVGLGLIAPRTVFAEWTKAAFEADKVDAAIKAMFGDSATSDSSEIELTAPAIAENGAVVPISVSTGMSGVESIAVMAEKNGTPMVAVFNLSDRGVPDVSVRIKMGETGNVTALVKAGGKLHKASKEVKVTIGGCGG